MDIQGELIDRFGDIPKPVSNLLDIAMLKLLAHNCYVEELSNKGNTVKFIMFNKAKIDVAMIPEFIKEMKNRIRFIPDKNPYFEYVLDVKKNGK